ncbi:AraC family transcriptional regulator [Glaciimonas sp. PAMC28666]|uniref:AraC family transcriptional regulator n=1 Tax=Glaciimonas sp. PAMC28666 TaxID=2807626 RepID=UPI0019646BE5|nr:helix-turn-helix transcriptional regulator [Glaciimonas sp. PAMC28666]QRX83407.1 AraC family transcriptional regulator [Glaciimonas sp. PAMC28666]
MFNASNLESNFISEKRNFENWVDTIHKLVNPVDLDSHDREKFNGYLTTHSLGDATYVLSSGGSAIMAQRNTSHIAEAKSHFFNLIVRRSGHGRIVHGGREINHSRGEFVLIDTKQELVNEMDDVNFSFVSIPDGLIRAWIPNPEDCVARVLSGDKGWAAVLLDYFSTLELDVVIEMTETQHMQMLEHILSLYSFALKEVGILPQIDPFIAAYKKTELYGVMYDWMTEHYMDSELSAGYMASKFHISIREVHRQFSLSSNGSTFLGSLHTMRMRAAIRMLRDKNFATLSMSEIGGRSGFNESAYFGKVFRKNMGCSPGAYAKIHQKKK